MSNTKSTFEDLEIWQLARNLRKEISTLVKTFPSEEKYRLTDQMIRAPRSVTANIAEGYGRYHFQENIQFCRQSRGSLYEIIDHLTVALDESYIKNVAFEDLKEKVFAIIRKLNGYIKYLETRKSSV
jgi:four helix bundle protein